MWGLCTLTADAAAWAADLWAVEAVFRVIGWDVCRKGGVGG